MSTASFSKNGFSSQKQFEFPAIINTCVLRGACPCECVHCPVGLTPKEKRGKAFGLDSMNLALFKKIVNEISKHPETVLRIHAVGEPLLWKDLLPALEFAKKKKVKNWIFTSAVTKNKKLLEKIAECCSIIEISVNSNNAEDYSKTKGINEFNLVRQNTKFLSEFRKAKKLKTRILATRVESNSKKDDEAFVKYWLKSGLIDDSFVRSFHNYNNVIENKFGKQIRGVVPCLVHWNRFNIDCSGEAVLCFNELFKDPKPNPSIVLGNVSKNKISKIWHCKKLENVRKAQLGKDYGLVNFAKKIPCEECFSCQPLEAIKPTSEKQVRELSRDVC